MAAIARVMSGRFDTLVFGGSNVGIMEAFARAFAVCGGRVVSVVPRWLRDAGLVFDGCEPTYCYDLASRKHSDVRRHRRSALLSRRFGDVGRTVRSSGPARGGAETPSAPRSISTIGRSITRL